MFAASLNLLAFLFCVDVLALSSLPTPTDFDLLSNGTLGIQALSVLQKQVEISLFPPLKPTVVVFLSSRCPCSQSYEQKLGQLAIEFKDKIQFVGIATNLKSKTAEEITAHFAQSPLAFDIILEQKLADGRLKYADHPWFKAVNTPHVFVLAPQNTETVVLYQGSIDKKHYADTSENSLLRTTLQEIVANREPTTSVNFSLGCRIER